MTVLTVEKEKIVQNLHIIEEKAGCPVIAVLKANAYGLGMKEMAGVLRANGVRRFGVTEPRDAQLLRDWGMNEEEILVMRSTACEADIKAIFAACATATVGSYDAAVALNGLAEKEGIVADVHIKIDTGMGRYGFDPTEIERVLSVFRFLTNLNVTGMFTHYACAFKSKKRTKEQYDQFMAVVAKVREAGLDPGMLHASNSSALFRAELPPLDAVRVGSALTGRVAVKGDFGLQKTGRLESEVAEVRWLPKGRTIGYGGAFVTRRPTKVAIIPVGTFDGFMVEKARDTFRFRDSLQYSLSSFANFLRGRRFFVLVGGKRARVLGHVGVTHTAVDVTEIDCSAGDRAVFEASPMFVPSSVERRYV